MYRYTLLLYCTQLVQMDCISVYTYVHCLPTHTCGAHTVLGSVVLLYVYTVVQALYTRTDSDQREHHKYNQTDSH